jgi:nickel-type superoxide dismutase maturation protease
MKSQLSSGKLRKRRFKLRRVVGESMLPTLRPGQLVAIGERGTLRVGDIVMILHDDMEKIKRVARIESGRLYVLGDNPNASTDSRNFGWIGAELVVGKVIWPRQGADSRSVQG